MHISSELFKDLKYNVFTLAPNKEVIKQWPELAKWEAFNPEPSYELKEDGEPSEPIKPFGNLNKDMVLRYILVLYDKNTPLLLIDNLAQRKTKAAEIAGFEFTKKDKWPIAVLKLFRGDLLDANRAILYFCRTQNSAKWGLYVTLTIKHHSDQEMIVNKDKDAPSSKELIADAETIDRLKSELINLDHTKSILDDMEEYTMAELGLRPEELGQKILAGDAVVEIRPYAK